jgi:hypothetical protein
MARMKRITRKRAFKEIIRAIRPIRVIRAEKSVLNIKL